MIIIHDYDVTVGLDGVEECICCERGFRCPVCDEILLCRDRRIRKYQDVDGNKHTLRIRRMKCSTCKRLHNELPDFLVPYKQHISFTIEKAVGELLMEKEILSEYIPDMKTMKRWKAWIEKNVRKINSNKEKISKTNQYIQKYSITIPFTIKDLVAKGKGWLSAILDLMLVNVCTCLSLP